MVLIGVLLGFRASRPTGWVAVRLVLVVVVGAFVVFVVLDGDVVHVELRVDLVGCVVWVPCLPSFTEVRQLRRHRMAL